MSETYTKQDAAERYDSARSLPKETSDLWMNRLRELLPLKSVQKVLDLGCGTGRFVAALQATFNCPVIAVDPSDAMLDEGRSRGDEEVQWTRGTGENIPLADNAVDLVWMSQVMHHLESTRAAFQEIRRILRSSGCLAIRNGTRENDAEIEWSQCFPEAQEIDDQRLPSQQEILDLVSNQGFEILTKETIYQYFASSYAEYYDKIGQRGLSSLIAISDEAFFAGLQRLKQWVDKQSPSTPVYEPVDLFVFRVRK